MKRKADKIIIKKGRKKRLESYTKKELINLINHQQKASEHERKFLYQKIKELDEQIRELRK